ncbi:hypothetical protein ABZ851_30000 [Streptomyces sp. NPDC047049]|uniref:hypothetical protein n=1 Tax=Streptomyces sp. NPDC047049 TaxID=3156688 RepID=UPI0033EA9F9C
MHDDHYAARDLGRCGLLQMRSLADPTSGAVRYWLTTRHVRGSVVLVPALLFADPTGPLRQPCDLYVFARLDGPGGAGRHERPLTVNGIELAGRTAVRLDQVDQIEAQRLGKAGITEPLPRHSRALARVVLAAAVEHWAVRSDRALLESLARRSTAEHFLSHYTEELAQREDALRRAQEDLADTRRRIELLRELSGPAPVP